MKKGDFTKFSHFDSGMKIAHFNKKRQGHQFHEIFFHSGIFTSSSTYPFTFRSLQISRIVKYWLGPALVLMMEWPDTCSLQKFSATIEQ